MDTRLSQQSTGGVHVHIENQSIKKDAFRHTKRSGEPDVFSEKKPLKRQINHFEAFMRNKPNFRNAKMNVRYVLTSHYENKSNWTLGENKPNSNPIQSQSKPKQTQIKPDMDPKQSQYKADQTQFQKGQ